MNQKINNLKLSQFIWRATACHLVTYFVAGILALILLHYKELFSTDIISVYMKPITSPWVAIGPILNVTRGVLFGFVLWIFKDAILNDRIGWLKLWILFLGFAIFGTAGPAPGSIEGLIYSNLSIPYQLLALPETVFQTLLFSILFFQWNKKPKKTWNVVMIILIFIIVILGLAGVFIKN